MSPSPSSRPHVTFSLSQTHKWFGPHCLYIPSHFSASQNVFDFYRISLEDFNIEFYSKFLCWLSVTERCYSTSRWMKSLYRNFLESFSSSSFSSSRHRFCHQQVLNLILNQKPFLWIPDTINTTPMAATATPTGAFGGAPGAGGETETESNDLVLGKMCTLSEVVIRDPTDKFFDHPLTPIRVLNRYYEDSQFLSLFTRVRICRVCTAYEGLFGTRGQPLETDRGDRAIYEQQCTCEDRGFGQYLGRMSGLVRSSPNLQDMLHFIKNLISKFQEMNNGEYDERATSAATDLLFINPTAGGDLLKRIKELLGIISREIWKCFNIQNSIHGYNPQALHEMRTEFTQESLLPTLNSKFVSLSAAHAAHCSSPFLLLAVDDMEIFKLFRSEFHEFEKQQQQSHAAAPAPTPLLHWIDGSNDEQAFWQEEEISDAPSYDLSEYEISFRKFFQLSSSEFYSKALTIPPETFFAPNSLLPLLKYLRVPTLSQFTTIQWVLNTQQQHRHRHHHHPAGQGHSLPPGTKTAAHAFLPLMNSLLVMSQGFILKEFSSMLSIPLLTSSSSSRIQRLRNLTVRSCDDLHRYVAVEIPQISLKVDAKKQSQEFHFNAQENILYLDSSVSYSRCRELVVFLICKAVKVEIALLTLNQQIDFMSSLRNNLLKYSKIQNFSVSTSPSPPLPPSILSPLPPSPFTLLPHFFGTLGGSCVRFRESSRAA
jgi:hypothetical protein